MSARRSPSRSSFILIVLLFTALGTAAEAQLKTAARQADYLVVSAPQFRHTMESFCTWRRSGGMNVLLTDIDDVAREFGHDTLTTPETLREFVSYALQYWMEPKPKYLLLVGDAEFMPSFKMRSFFAYDTTLHEDSVSIDEWYGVNRYDPDTRPDIAIGRFPAKSSVQLETMIQKTMLFEDQLSRKHYANDLLVITDRIDAADFEAAAGKLIEDSVLSRYRRTVLHFGDSTESGGTRRKLFDAINGSTMFFSNFIHGNPFIWSRDRTFTYADVDSLAGNHRPFILASIACSQRFDVPADSVLVERLLAKPDGGAVAVFATAGLSYLYEGDELVKEFYRGALSQPSARIGSVILAAKQNSLQYLNCWDFPDGNIRRYTLLGDPALRLAKDLVAAGDDGGPALPKDFVLGQNFPNPFNPVTTIRYSIPKDAVVTITVYDLLGRVVSVVVNEWRAAGTHEARVDASALASGMYLYRMQAGGFTAVKKMMLVK